MSSATLFQRVRVTGYTAAIGALGAAVAIALSLPAAVLIGPALAVSLVGLTGLRLEISEGLRNVFFVALGLGIGAGFDTDASAAILRWPLAFVVLGAMLLATLHLCRVVLQRGFGFDRHSAVLAAAPGHLSFVLGLAAETGGDVGRIAVVQTIRVLLLTLIVPFVALAMGYEMSVTALSDGPLMRPDHLALLAVAGVAAGLGFRRFGLPAPMLLGPLAVSALAHVSDLTPGAVPPQIMTPAFLLMGTLIGTRFSGMSWAQFRASLLAGLTITLIAVITASLAALPVAVALGMPGAHVMTAFAPGGLETMIALAASMGASPGFVAACHIMRLLILTALVPLTLGRRRRA